MGSARGPQAVKTKANKSQLKIQASWGRVCPASRLRLWFPAQDENLARKANNPILTRARTRLPVCFSLGE